jgi:hypothetical protein
MYNTDLPTRAELPSARQLLRSTLIAAATAGVLLVAAVMPAEYGIDPTGIGSALGLKRMGEIKTSLAAPVSAPSQASPAPAVQAPAPVPVAASTPAAAAPSTQAVASATPKADPADKTDEMSLTLKPGQAAEIKLDMRKGAKVAYRWTVRGGHVNFDTHGDPIAPKAGFYHGYGKGSQATRDEGVLQAAFDGKHGWYWRNRSQADATVTLTTQGGYTAIQRVL